LERFCSTVTEAEALTRPDEFDAYRCWASTMLAFAGGASFLRDVHVPEHACGSGSRARHQGAARHEPHGHAEPAQIRSNELRPAALGAPCVVACGVIDRRYYELCVLSNCVTAARRRRVGYGQPTLSRFRGAVDLSRDPAGIAAERRPADRGRDDFESFIAGRRAFLDERLALIDTKAKDGLLPDVTIDKGALKITPIAKSTPPEASPRARLYAMLPRVRITTFCPSSALDALS